MFILLTRHQKHHNFQYNTGSELVFLHGINTNRGKAPTLFHRNVLIDCRFKLAYIWGCIKNPSETELNTHKPITTPKHQFRFLQQIKFY